MYSVSGSIPLASPEFYHHTPISLTHNIYRATRGDSGYSHTLEYFPNRPLTIKPQLNSKKLAWPLLIATINTSNIGPCHQNTSVNCKRPLELFKQEHHQNYQWVNTKETSKNKGEI